MATLGFYVDTNNENKWTIIKDPDSVLDYNIDWTTWLIVGDSLSVSTWAADVGITIDSSSETSGIATVWLSGGEDGNSYEVTNSITTTGGRQDDRTFVVKVQER